MEEKQEIIGSEGIVTSQEAPKLGIRNKLFARQYISLAVILLFAVGGTYYLVASHAASSASAIIGIGGKCLDNYANLKKDGNKIQLYTCNGSAAQNWAINTDGTITNANDYCLNATGSVRKSLVTLSACNKGSLQQWTVDSTKNLIISEASGLCLDDQYGKTTDGNPIQVYECNGTASQTWKPQVKIVTQQAVSPGSTALGLTLTASSSVASVTTKDPVTLTWNSTDTTSCTASGGWSGAKAVSGSELIGPLKATTAFTLDCSGAAGKVSTTATVTVKPAPVATSPTSPTGPTPTPTPSPAPAPAPTDGTLVFDDEFNGAAGTLPDSSKWNIFSSGSSWGSQCWKKDPSVISQDGQGNLKLSIVNKGTTQCTNSYGDSSTYAGGGMDTTGKFSMSYGKVEVRAKLSCADGIWGSFWMSTGTGPSWPQSGEIDFYELGYNKMYRLQQTVHVGTSSSNQKQKAQYVDLPTNQRWCDAFHVYGAEKRQNVVNFWVDGKITNTVKPSDFPGYSWPFNTYNNRILIDQQYSKNGTWSGNITPSQLPATTLIDYVRVYK